MSYIFVGFAILAAWWIVFIIVGIARKQTPIAVFLIILFFVWAVPEVLLLLSNPEFASVLFYL